MFQSHFPPVSLLILFFFACFLISPQTTFTFAALPHPPPSLSPSSSSPSPLHLSLLSHLFCISNLGCFKVNVCVRLSHNPGPHIQSTQNAHMLGERYTLASDTSQTRACLCTPPPQEVAAVSPSSPFTPSHLCLAHSVAQFSAAQCDTARRGSAPHAIRRLNQ